MQILLLLLLLIYPYLISKIIDQRKTTKTKTKTKIKAKAKAKVTDVKQIVLDLGIIILITVISVAIAHPILFAYPNPSWDSNLCIRTGTFTSSCKGDLSATPMIAGVGLIVIIHHFLTQFFVYKIFENLKGVLKYVFMYIHMFIIYYINVILVLVLYGIFSAIHYDSVPVELLRFLVAFSPTGLFLVSSLIYAHKNK